jgi:hypothetical protein
VTASRRDGIDGLAVVMAALIGLDAVLWLAARCSAWLDGRRLPSGHLLAALGALAHFGDPSRAWGARVAGPVLYWAVAGLFLVMAGLVFWALRRVWRSDAGGREDPAQAEGLADREQVRRAAGNR